MIRGSRPRGLRLVMLAAFFVSVATSACTSACASLRLASLDAIPAGTRLSGPSGGYELTLPTDAWARNPADEERGRIDLALVRKSGDAWLNVSVMADRYPAADLALAAARTRADALMLASEREERDVAVVGPAGALPGRLGVYCGSFDREVRSRDSCFVIQTVVDGRTAWLLVGQVRMHEGGDERRDELERLMGSLRILSTAPPQAREQVVP